MISGHRACSHIGDRPVIQSGALHTQFKPDLEGFSQVSSD